jgi:hypothetical protein
MKTPIKSTTQKFLEIEDIVEDLVIMVDGSAGLVLETGAVNFGLLSRDEQEAIVYAFAAFLNSLSFPIQISILSKRMDISDYLNLITSEEQKQPSLKLKEKLASYRQYILSLVKENTVLEKRFFIVIPFSSFELGVKGGGSLVKKTTKLPYPKNYIIERAKTALYPKRDHIARQLTRIGLKANQLTNQKLISLFYELYNSESQEGEKIPQGITNPLVQPFSMKKQ